MSMLGQAFLLLYYAHLVPRPVLSVRVQTAPHATSYVISLSADNYSSISWLQSAANFMRAESFVADTL